MNYQMITEYITSALKKANYEFIKDEQAYYGEIPPLSGVYANADTLSQCREKLREVLEEWILLRIHLHYPIPEIDGFSLDFREVNI